MFPKCLLFLCAVMALAHARTIIVGQTSDPTGAIRVVGQKIVEKYPLPFIKRTDEINFELEPPYLIKGIAVRDVEGGMSEAAISSGGLGFSFVTIKLKSERGAGYKYMIEIFA